MNAEVARLLSEIDMSLEVDSDVVKACKEVLETAIDGKRARRYVYFEVQYTGSKTKELVSKLQNKGFKVECRECEEDGYSDLTIRW